MILYLLHNRKGNWNLAKVFMKKVYTKKDMHLLKYYKDARGVLIKKYRNLLGHYILVIDENDKKTKISVNYALYSTAQLGTKWTIGHIKGSMINCRPGLCKKSKE